MASNMTISLPSEIRERLKKEANQSALIARLLSEYFNDCRTEEQILEDTKKAIEKKEHDEKLQKMIEAQLKKEEDMGLTI